MPAPQFPATTDGVPIAILQVVPGQSQEKAIPGVATAFAVNAAAVLQCFRVWSIGCDSYFNYGNSGIAAPTAADAFVPNGAFMDTYLSPAQTHMRVVPKTGTGTFRVEQLG